MVLNMSDASAAVEGVAGRIAACTDMRRDGEAVDKGLTVAGWTGAVVVSG